MRRSTSIWSPILAFGIHGAGSIATNFGCFVATAALADGAGDDLNDDSLCMVNCKVTMKRDLKKGHSVEGQSPSAFL